MLYLLRILVPLIFVASCGNQPAKQAVGSDTILPAKPAFSIQKDSFASGTVIDRVTCLSNGLQSYALYIPLTKKDTVLPVVFFFDPHGDGILPLAKYKPLADAFGFLFIGSNNSKNGNDWNVTQTIIQTLLSDAQNRLPIDTNRMYTCGFSGGAKVASYAALHNSKIKEVLAAGAGLPDGEAVRNFPFYFTGMAGKGDMNMTDLIALNNAFDKTETRHRIILFDGKHAWPPADIMRTALAGVQLDAMREKLVAVHDSLIRLVSNNQKQKITQARLENKQVAAFEMCNLTINLLSGLPLPVNWFITEKKAIESSSAYQQQEQQAQQLFIIERDKKQVFQQQFERGDAAYWSATITGLQQKAKLPTAEGAMYQRLLAYLSLAFYSISNQLLNSMQIKEAQYFVTLYKMADATNPEAWYFSALINARNSNTKATENDLVKAAGYGFTDTARLVGQPEFQVLSPPISFPFIESKMKKATE